MNNQFIISISQLGYLPESTKLVTLVCKDKSISLPNEIPFYLQHTGSHLKRKVQSPDAWKGKFFHWPFDLGAGEPDPDKLNIKSHTDKPLFEGILYRADTRWGTFWQGEFTHFKKEGIYQIETAFQISVPFEIRNSIYQRTMYGYMEYIHAQRSGYDMPGIRSAEHLDDAVLDSTGKQIFAVGGWYDAGDFRKWLTLTLGNLRALQKIATCGIQNFESRAIEEIKWGNKYFHAMISEEGKVFEDVGGGKFKDGLDIEKDWWYENHPGCNCDNAGNVVTDNKPDTGDERLVRTNYNPFVQFQYVYYQAMISGLFNDTHGETCKSKAIKAWEYGVSREHDNRTLFLSSQILAAVELYQIDPGHVDLDMIKALTRELLNRQNKDDQGISGYFMEKDNSDGFRSIAFSNFPVQALLNVRKLLQDPRLVEQTENAIVAYVENYLMVDAQSNPFSVIPYGIYHKTPYSEFQKFRDAGKGKYIRSFIHPLSHQEIIHGTNSVLMAHAAFLAEASHLFDKPTWKTLAEKLICWAMGHNPDGMSLFTGIGYKHPVLYSNVHVQIPHAACAGYIGTPDDIPYLETSNWVEWSTQEVWDVPHYELAIASIYLMKQ